MQLKGTINNQLVEVTPAHAYIRSRTTKANVFTV